MNLCGIELKSNNIILSLIDTRTKQYINIKEKKLTITDDEDTSSFIKFSLDFKKFLEENSVEIIAVKKRAKKGNFAGGALTFKLEALIQLSGLNEIILVSPQKISTFEKKNDIYFPKGLNKYQEQSYLTALASI